MKKNTHFVFRNALDDMLEKRAKLALAEKDYSDPAAYRRAEESFDAAYEAFVDAYKPEG